MKEIVVKGLCQDSRRVNPGDLFVALKGFQSDGQSFIQSAIEKGAVAILTENAPSPENVSANVPIIPYSDLKNALGFIAAQFFDHPSDAMQIIGVTGTNGKTSCTHYIAQALNLLGKRCGVMGTLGAGFLPALQDFATGCTTSDAITTQSVLAEGRDAGASVMAIEVTSHALTQSRMNGVKFHTAIFTNLTRDHLDYHHSMEAYWAAKKRLFTEFNPMHNIINLDDPYGRLLFEESRQKSQKWLGYTLSPALSTDFVQNTTALLGASLITTENVILNASGMQVRIQTPWGEGQFQCPFLGHFSLSNVLATLAALCLQGFTLNAVLAVIEKLQTVPGRMSYFGGGNQPVVIVDYAHTPNALKEVLTALRPHCKGKLICVFGCGGDRDVGKRPIMAKIAETLSDKIIVTQDNPRNENPDTIIQNILEGFSDLSQVVVEPNRAQAIAKAIRLANQNDLIIVAGKGHEKYQIIGNEKIPFDDQEIVQNELKRRTE